MAHPSRTHQDAIAGADFHALGLGHGLQGLGIGPEPWRQNVHALRAGHVEQHAAPNHRCDGIDAPFLHAPPALLIAAGVDSPAQLPVLGHVRQRVDVRAGVAAHDDQLVRRAVAAGPEGVAMAPLQGEDVWRMRRMHRHAHLVARAQVIHARRGELFSESKIRGWCLRHW